MKSVEVIVWINIVFLALILGFIVGISVRNRRLIVIVGCLLPLAASAQQWTYLTTYAAVAVRGNHRLWECAGTATPPLCEVKDPPRGLAECGTWNTTFITRRTVPCPFQRVDLHYFMTSCDGVHYDNVWDWPILEPDKGSCSTGYSARLGFPAIFPTCANGVEIPATSERDAVEINHISYFMLVVYDLPGGPCYGGSCSQFETWTRINRADNYNAPHQFKMWVANQAIYYEDNRASFPLTVICDGGFGTLALTNFSVVNGPQPYFVMNFNVTGKHYLGECNGTCITNGGNPHIEVNTCDLSGLRGFYQAPVNTCNDNYGGVWQVNGYVQVQ